MKSRLIILDANTIIQGFRFEFWSNLITSYDVAVSSIVLRGQVYHFVGDHDQEIPIDLQKFVDAGQVKELTATGEQIQNVADKVNPSFLNRIDDGELEAIALLLAREYDKYQFCTGDTRAIKAMESLAIGNMGVSLEELLDKIGEVSKLPDRSYSKKVFDLKKAEGHQEKDMFLKN